LKKCIDDNGVDFCYAEEQLKEINKQRRLRKDTKDVARDKTAETSIAASIKQIKSDSSNLKSRDDFDKAMKD